MSTYQKYYNRFEHGLFGNCTLGILASSCLGGIAAMAVLMHGNGFGQMTQLFFVICVSMMFNGAVISQQKPKTIFNLLILSVVVNTLLFAINFH
ncbi:hypothetical protein FNO01nite_08150 [Flavobacterium noncentrifugens]|uniref:Uncharacterized protein n=1 Tax=Flavobacterium noncentrifugens TaxID=1128970 RepID=A0A1G8TA79_9FLAO|nr:hypothetical protein [Flavobacterium noncentrifugens]GEP50143.1 hypothetical protein FNO01nite_08150 [Flavobacterium noncentrifugens]SDJ38314.1 hypothetical protein SAMN04487935_0887 [Flavobacterium noncentrifugens]